MKYITSLVTTVVELEVYECQCGFHIGIDATFLDQVSGVNHRCMSCDRVNYVKGGGDK